MMEPSIDPTRLTAPDSGDENGKAPNRLRLADLMRRKHDIRSVALTGLFVLAVFYTMYFMRAILLPLVLAVMLSYLLRPIVRAFARIHVPLAVSSGLVLIMVLAVASYAVTSLAAPATAWVEKAPYSVKQLQTKLHAFKRPMEKVAQASGAIEKLATPDEPAVKMAVEVKRHPLTEALFTRTPELVTSAILFLVLLYFLLASDGVFLGKLIRLLPTLSDKKRAVSIATEIEGQVSRYLFTQTLINVGLGIAVGTSVGLLGLPNPIMWGTMVAVLNFIPYLGAFTGIICIALAAILSFDSLTYALIFPAVYLGFAALEGHFITPWIMGRSLTLNPVMIILSLTFWGWMWGIPGIILAVPILAALKILCSHLEPMAPLAEFLS